MDIDKMKRAAQKLKGSHDFRNFCKKNVLATTSFVRYIMEVDISRVQEIHFDPFVQDYNRVDELELYPSFAKKSEKIEEIQEEYTSQFGIEEDIPNPFD